MPETPNIVSLQRHLSTAVITIDNPPVNALSQRVRQGLLDCLEAAEADPQVKIIVIHCAGRTFVAGADIAEFGKPPVEPHLPDVLNAIEQSAKPVVAALHGTALGGGFELALACHYRIALRGSRVGLPEVTLGLIPGAGGTQRLPRLAGLETALQMITSGKPVMVENLAETFVDVGKPVINSFVINSLVEKDLLPSAIQFAEEIKDQPFTRTCDLSVAAVKDHAQLLDQWRSRLAKKSRGQIAPQKAIQSIENSLLMAFSQALRKERELFIECRNSPQSAAMRHAFFAERQASKVKDLNDDIVAPEINSVAVIGAGTMGTAIAMCFANAHIQVTLLELNKTQLQKGLDRITSRYQQSVKRGRITPEAFKRHMACISTTCDYQDLADADLVVEAAFESMDVKKTIFKQLDQICKPEAILASNTSYLDIDSIARVTTRPANIIGLHFFSPADIMKLLEIVRAEKTSAQAIKTAVTLAKRIKKIPVVVGNAYGFVGNAMYASYGREAQMLLLEGATPEQVDKAMTDWGMAMGPFAVNDLSGIDIAYKARRENPHLPDDPCYFRPADLMVEAGRLGQKTGAGFYHYSAATGERQPDPDAINIIRTEAIKLGVPQRQNIADTEIQQRLVMALINQGNTLLEQGIATRASDIDVIWLNGYGFPRFRGGPMCYANEMSLLD